MNHGDARVLDRINDAVKLCKIRSGGNPSSILFGIEKSGAVQLIDTAKEILTDNSRALAGSVGQPPKLIRRLNILAAAFKRPTTRVALPWSIRGLWKADLFVGSADTQQWVGTSVKINPTQLGGRRRLTDRNCARRDRGGVTRWKWMSAVVLSFVPCTTTVTFMQVFYRRMAHCSGISGC